MILFHHLFAIVVLFSSFAPHFQIGGFAMAIALPKTKESIPITTATSVTKTKTTISLKKQKQYPSVLLSREEPPRALYREAWSPHLSAWDKFSLSFLPKNKNKNWSNPASLLFGRNKHGVPPNCITHVTAQWTLDEKNLFDTATRVSDEINDWFDDEDGQQKQQSFRNVRRDHLLRSMETFANYCATHLQQDRIAGYKLKISNLRGSRFATPCPAFHVDDVPCRYVETLYGPGTVVLDPSRNDYDSTTLQSLVTGDPPNEIDENDDWKEHLVAKECTPDQASFGKPTLLIGHRWKDFASADHHHRSVVLHRSPRGLHPNQGRILLVLDVVETDDESSAPCCDCCPGGV